MCETAGVAQSGYYAWRKRADRPTTPGEQRRLALSEKICEIFHQAMEGVRISRRGLAVA